MSALLVSDLHLSAATPRTAAAFVAFVRKHAVAADALWILGDLFEAWVGDEALDDADERAWLMPVVEALAECARRVPLRMIPGNRDFLLGPRFAQATGSERIDEPWRGSIGSVDTLLMHGDTLCTADTDYLRFRAMVRSPAWQADFLGRPYAERRAIAARLRAGSREAGAAKDAAITDADPEAADALLASTGATRLVHGHTHRPGRHHHPHGERLVLGDWDFDTPAGTVPRGGGLRLGPNGSVECIDAQPEPASGARPPALG